MSSSSRDSSRSLVSRDQTRGRSRRSSTPKPRISKACEECRRRKVKCDGLALCKPCQVKGLSWCSYRQKARERRPKQANKQRASVISAKTKPTQSKEIDDKVCKSYIVPEIFPRSVRRASPFPPHLPYQLHYGASSNISLVNHLYQSFNPLFGGDFLIRRLHNFSESLGESNTEMNDLAAISEMCQKTIFLADEVAPALAEEILEHFLAVHQLLIPVQTPRAMRNDLRSLYDIESIPALSNVRRRAMLLVLATSSLTTRHHKLADIFIYHFNESSSPADDNLTTWSIEIDCLLISISPPSVVLVTNRLPKNTPSTTPKKDSSTTHIYQ